MPELARGPVYLCGPDAMMGAMRGLLRGLGLPDDALRTEAFVSPGPGAADEAAPADARVSTVLEAAAGPAPGAPGLTGAGGRVRFQRSGREADQPPGQTLLETAEGAGVEIAFECRAGICGQCKTRLLAGRVAMDSDDALSAAEKARGYILACQAHSLGDVTVDA